MKVALFFLLVVSQLAMAEDRTVAAQVAASDAKSCGPTEISRLFDFSVEEYGRSSQNAEMSEFLAGVNEEVFLACPEAFLVQLASASEVRKSAVTRYFGLFEREKVGCSLLRLKEDHRFRSIIDEELASLILEKTSCPRRGP